MAYYVKTHASREAGMIDKRDHQVNLYNYNDSVISYGTEPETDYVEDPAFDPQNAVLINENPEDCRIYRFIQVANYSTTEAP